MSEQLQPDTTSLEPQQKQNESSRLTYFLLTIILLYIVFRFVICFVKGDETSQQPWSENKPDCPEVKVVYAFDQWVNEENFHINMGLAYGNAGLFDQAIFEYRQVLRINPNHTIAHNNMGWVYGQVGRLEEAIEELKTAINLDPDLSLAKNNLHDVFQKWIAQAKTPEERSKLEAERNAILGVKPEAPSHE